MGFEGFATGFRVSVLQVWSTRGVVGLILFFDTVDDINPTLP